MKKHIKTKKGVTALVDFNMDDKEVMQYAIEHDILEKENVCTAVWNMKREDYLKQHPYRIWQNAEGIWMTHLQDENGRRLLRKRKSREELEDLLVKHYRSLEQEVYIGNVFTEWMDGKLKYGEIKKQSYDRYRTDFDRFFKKADRLCQKKFKNITEEDLEFFIKTKIHELGLTRKSYSGLVTILGGVFRYGKKRGYTELSITSFFGDLVLPKNIFTKKYKDKATEVFMESEISMVTNYLKENPDIWNLGLLLQLQTGARIGEIAALKHEDLKETGILIRRTEIKFKNDEGHWTVTVSAVPKTDAGYREIIIPSSARWTVEQILRQNPDGEFLFMSKGKRIRGNTFNKRLADICDKLNLQHRSSHKIRKTYGTTLLDSSVNDSIVAEQMGHTDVSTTRKLYYYSNKSRETKLQQIEQAVTF
jgi:integrase